MKMATFVAAVGVMTIVLSLLTKLIGFPDQMRKNHQRKSVEGVSVAFYALSFITYVTWTLYGVLKKDPIVAIAQGLGVVTTGIICYQIVIYRKKN
jgi:uncharacterized protein with PQ loop repeat